MPKLTGMPRLSGIQRVLRALPSHLTTSQMCFRAELSPIPPSSWEFPALQLSWHLEDEDSE